MKLEIACFNLESALAAQQAGADRVELCAGREWGGITPAPEMVRQARALLTIDIMVMIRPRGGNFIYSAAELEQMKKDITAFKSCGINGYVFGVLAADNTISKEQNAELVALAQPLCSTFHRAFDETAEIRTALEDVISCGFATVLTSGHAGTAQEGMDVLAALQKQASGRITVMPGGGIRAAAIAALADKVKAGWYHSSAITGQNSIADANEIKQLKQNLH